MKAKTWIGIIGAIIFILGFIAKIGSWVTGSPYGDLYILMMIIGALMVASVKFVNWLQR
jgi:hypothetical protein